ncbi:MAG: nitroreductase family protein [Clostridia bacterium]|nr:nitroreductase family protein [Clostridia bacterium]
MLKDILLKTRSYRRFYQDVKIPESELRELVDLTRYTPSTGNTQPLKYMIITGEEECEKVFSTLGWAGLLKDWDGPVQGERPSAYIIILCDNTIGRKMDRDDGICAQTIMIGAVEKGYGGCMLGNINRPLFAEYFGIDTEKYSIDLCLALGKPKEKVVLTEVGENKSTAYYRDDEGTHYVPKRSLEEIIIK